MISEFILSINSYNVPLSFIAHLIIFIGALYVALHNRNLPQWHITPLWYLGLVHLFTGCTTLVQWTIGPEHPLSYWNMGLFGEVLCNISLAAIVLVMFIVTLRQDILGSKKRRLNS